MTVQWISEREASNRQPIANDVFKTKQDFLPILAAYREGLLPSFRETVEWVIEQGGEIGELEQRVAIICSQLDAHIFPDSINLLMNLVCAAALARSPNLETWKRVKHFKYQLWQLEHWLTPAMMAYASLKLSNSTAYVELAKVVLKALDDFKLESLSSRHNQERIGAWTYWNECRDKLDQIWWGLRGWHEMSYEDDLPLFRVLYQLAPDEFVSIVVQSTNNPYLVHSLLLVTGVGPFSPRFAEWKRISSNAPVAFEVDGTWNGSVLLPLLLVEARDQLLQTGRSVHRLEASDADIESVKHDTANLVDAVVTALASRDDSLPMFARWSTWLMRQLLNLSEKDVSDIRSSAFIDNALIEAIGSRLKDQAVVQSSPKDAFAWEVWSYRCVLASHAHSGYIGPPDYKQFMAEWNIKPDEWIEKGKVLRERASLVIASKDMPGMAAHYLAYPIVKSSDPATTWLEMWKTTYSLREIIEFGDADVLLDEYHARSVAGELLLLLFRIGLAIFDQRAPECLCTDSPVSRSQAKLHEALASALREMHEIDDTINRDKWLDAIRHLATRRLIWEEQTLENQKSNRFSIFRPEDAPTFSDYLKAAKSNVIELLSVLQSALLNDPDICSLQKALSAASVNLSDTVQIARRLNRYDPRRYPIDEAQLQRLDVLILR